MIDLKKLTPAPWQAQGEGICCGLYAEPGHMLIFDPDSTWADASFIALARNAFDVMLRRGWYAYPPSSQQVGWGVDARPQALPMDLCKLSWPDPFTALVEAEKWYVANVEGKR